MTDYSLDFDMRWSARPRGCSISFHCFDTPNRITVFDESLSRETAERALLDARNLCLDLHRLWSFSRDDSDIARINGPALRVDVDPRTAELLGAMRSFHETEPLFDFTIGPVSYLWKNTNRLPDPEELERARQLVNAKHVAIEGTTVIKADARMRVDVGGAAKGFAADGIAALLPEYGFERADIDLGGNVYLLGNHPEGRPWRLEIHIPEGTNAPRTMLTLADASAVTSGTYERFATVDGKRYHHIIDPTTGMPSLSDIMSATVCCRSSLQADMLATTALLAGSNGLEALAARHGEAQFVAILETGRVLRFNESEPRTGL